MIRTVLQLVLAVLMIANLVRAWFAPDWDDGQEWIIHAILAGVLVLLLDEVAP